MSASEISESWERTVPVFRSGERVKCKLSWARFHDRTYRINIDSPAGPISATADDLFSALQQIRSALGSQDWLIGVQGARKDAYPSGMLRDTVGARRVYILYFGKDMDRNDLVDIFAEADVSLLGTVDQQVEYYRNWRLSVARRTQKED